MAFWEEFLKEEEKPGVQEELFKGFFFLFAFIKYYITCSYLKNINQIYRFVINSCNYSCLKIIQLSRLPCQSK